MQCTPEEKTIFCGPKRQGGMKKWHNRRKRISRFKCSLRRHNSLNFLRISIFMILSCELINSERKSRWNWKSRKLFSPRITLFLLINSSHFSIDSLCKKANEDILLVVNKSLRFCLLPDFIWKKKRLKFKWAFYLRISFTFSSLHCVRILLHVCRLNA